MISRIPLSSVPLKDRFISMDNLNGPFTDKSAYVKA